MIDCTKCRHYRAPASYSARDTREPRANAECGKGHWIRGIHVVSTSCEDFKEPTWWQENQYTVFLVLIAIYILVVLMAEFGLFPGGNK